MSEEDMVAVFFFVQLGLMVASLSFSLVCLSVREGSDGTYTRMSPDMYACVSMEAREGVRHPLYHSLLYSLRWGLWLNQELGCWLATSSGGLPSCLYSLQL